MESRGFGEGGGEGQRREFSREDVEQGETHEPGGAAPGSNEEMEEERQAVQERKAISARVVYHAILAEGESELGRPTSALAFSGFAAGLSMGFSFIAQGFMEAHLPVAPWAQLISKLGYSTGFLIVILGRQQLFTENTLTPVVSFLKHKELSVLRNILRLWAAVFIANWAGTMLVAWVLAKTSIIPEAARPMFLELGRSTLGHDFATTLLQAVFAGWLIALLVWLLPFAESARVAVIIIMAYVIALGSFRHVVAGSVDSFYLVAMGDVSFVEYLGRFMAPTLLGNIAGGISLVAVLNHAQVHAGTD
jgi:formate/nitrite transporter FocA (FNT family)